MALRQSEAAAVAFGLPDESVGGLAAAVAFGLPDQSAVVRRRLSRWLSRSERGGQAAAVAGVSENSQRLYCWWAVPRWLPHELVSGRFTLRIARVALARWRAATRVVTCTANVQRFARMAAVAESPCLRTSRDPRDNHRPNELR